MNYLISIFILVISFTSYSQSWEAKLENAQFRNRVHNNKAFSCQVTKINGTFTSEEFELIERKCLIKEGIFKMTLSSDERTITLGYLDWIDQLTIQLLFNEAIEGIFATTNFSPKGIYSF